MDFNYLTPISVGFFTAFIMGPVFWVLLETSITKGLRAAVAFDIGVILADVLFILATYYGSVKLFLSESNKEGLFVLGGTLILLVILLTLGLIVLVSADFLVLIALVPVDWTLLTLIILLI